MSELGCPDHERIYRLKLHEQTHLENNMTVTRVPGGWIYTYFSPTIESGGKVSDECRVSSTFVPFSKEFLFRNEATIDENGNLDESVLNDALVKCGNFGDHLNRL